MLRNVGKNAGGGSVTAQQRCSWGSVYGTAFWGLYYTTTPRMKWVLEWGVSGISSFWMVVRLRLTRRTVDENCLNTKWERKYMAQREKTWLEIGGSCIMRKFIYSFHLVLLYIMMQHNYYFLTYHWFSAMTGFSLTNYGCKKLNKILMWGGYVKFKKYFMYMTSVFCKEC